MMDVATSVRYYFWVTGSKVLRGEKSGDSAAVVPCPVEQAIHVVGGKWKLLILRSLLLNGPQGYNQLLSTVTGISAKELTRNTRELIASGLIERPSDNSSRTSAYTLTKLGKTLMPTFKSLLTWGQRLLASGDT